MPASAPKPTALTNRIATITGWNERAATMISRAGQVAHAGIRLRAATRPIGSASTMPSALARTAIVEDGRANWEMALGDGLVGWDGLIRTQWCHGAAGVAEAAAGYLDEDTLIAAGDLVWEAGQWKVDSDILHDLDSPPRHSRRGGFDD